MNSLITMLVAALFLVVAVSTYFYLKEKEAFTWWKWALCLLWTALFFVVCAFIGTTIGEGEPQATLRGGAAFIFIAAVGALILYRIVFHKAKPKEKVQTENE